MNNSNLMRGALAVALVVAFCAALAALFWLAVPESNRDMVTFMLGQLSGFAATALAFFFGTTQGNANKDRTIANLADSKDSQQ